QSINDIVLSISDFKEATMPRAWTEKDERQYKHILKSARDDGKGEDRAKEIAARTVNKQRREDGRTPSRSTSGTGNPNQSLEQRSKKELASRAAELHIKGRSSMDKSELVQAIRSAR